MSSDKARKIMVPAATESFAEVQTFIEEGLRQKNISSFIISETMLVYEALFHNILEQGYDQDTILTIYMQKSIGEIYIQLKFDGKPFVPVIDREDDISPDNRILEAYNDKIDCMYHMGCNSIRITVKRSYRTSLLSCLGGIGLAVVAFFLISALMDAQMQDMIQDRIVLPMVKLFANAMLMVGTPVTFFSLLKNLADIYIIAERNSGLRKRQIKTIATSIISILLAIAMSIVLILLIRQFFGDYSSTTAITKALSFSEMIASLVPSSIFAPFEVIAPFPLIFVALLVTYAFCSVGKYFDKMKKAVDALYMLFSKMLNVVIFTLPFFCFLSIFYLLLHNDLAEILIYLGIIVLVAISLIVMILFYMIRMKVGRVKIIPFAKKLPGLIRENLKINSAIDAVPFNVRYCAKHYGMNRKKLEDNLSTLAQINLDGNCYLIMILALMFISFLGLSVSWFHILMIAIIVAFLSFGAPNQPGSILIGLLIISLYLGEEGMVPAVICMEVIFGPVQNIINVIGDIVTEAIEEM